MSRRIYRRTDETFKVLVDHVAPVAREMECDYSHINRIKNDEYPDPYAPFRELFRRAAAANAPAEIWLNDLMAILLRSKKGQINVSELSGNVLRKLQSDSETLQEILQATSDNHLDKSECHLILKKLDTNETINTQIKEIVLHRLAEENEK